MQPKTSYYYFKSALTNEECDKILKLGENKLKEYKDNGQTTAGNTAGNSHKQAMSDTAKPLNDKTFEENGDVDNTYVRDSEVAWLTEDWLYDKIWPFINTANKEAGWNFDVDWAENFQFTKYGLNQFYGWHNDSGGDTSTAYKRYYPGVNGFGLKPPVGYATEKNWIGKVRKLSVTINLSEDDSYTGGNLKFDYGPHFDEDRFKECTEIRPRGSIIVFPSFLYHQVTPVTSGTRYSLVLWALGRPFK